jgi:hypothetical protein
VIGSAWAAPVILLAVATPAHAASGGGDGGDVFTSFVDGPNDYEGQSQYSIIFTNTGPGPLPGDLLVSMQEGPGFYFSGFSGYYWEYGPAYDGGLTFIYPEPTPAGEDVWTLLLYLDKDPEGPGSPDATATLLVTATGYQPVTLTLKVPY